MKARKAWTDYKTKHDLCDQKVMDGLQEGIDYKMLCFSALTEPSKKKNQLVVEEMKQKRGLGVVSMDSSGQTKVSFGVVPDFESESEEDEV